MPTAPDSPAVAVDVAPKRAEADADGVTSVKKIMGGLTGFIPGWPGIAAQLGAVGVLMWLVCVQMPQEREMAAKERGTAMQTIQDIHRQHERSEAKMVGAINALTVEIRAMRHGGPDVPEKPGKGGD